MKALSTLISIILILMIVTTLAMSLFLFLTQTQSSLLKSVEEEQKIARFGSEFKILSANEEKIIIKNTGKYDLTDFAVYVNDIKIDASAPEILRPGETGIIILLSAIYEEGTVTVTTSYAKAMSFLKISCLELKTGNNYINKSTRICKKDYVNSKIIINANNIILDCNFAVLKGTLTSGYAITSSSKSNVTIENCDLRNFYNGIIIYYSNNSQIKNINVNNTTVGIAITEGSNNILSFSNVRYASYIGIVDKGGYTRLTNNTANNNNYGIYAYGTGTKINNNTACYNAAMDIYCYGMYEGSGNKADKVQCQGLTGTIAC